MNPDTLALWIALDAARGWSPRRIACLLDRFGTLPAALNAGDDALALLGIPLATRNRLRRLHEDAARLWPPVARWLEADPRHHLLTLEDPRYPPQLRQIADPPPLLWVRGDPELLALPQIALVGSRRASAEGLRNAASFADALAQAGLVITSGLASGIDGAAHEGALRGQGLTLAVLGCGVDRCYPAAHRRLAERILAGEGALVSEFPLGAPPLAGHFPRRNRIISGLSLGVLVVEAAERSGTLVTARLAAEQGREVFALPGSIHNPAARGCHQLIRQGALLVDAVEQILEQLGPQIGTVAVERAAAPAPMEDEAAHSAAARVLAALAFGSATPVDLVVARSGLSAAEVQSELLALELEGRVAAVGGGYQRLS